MEKKRNLWVIPSDKPSNYVTSYMEKEMQRHNIYITNSEEIKEGDWVINLKSNGIYPIFILNEVVDYEKKITLTTDQDLIKDGVQAMNDEFLEWFIKNPSCEEVEIIKQHQYHSSKEFYIDADYVNCSEEQYESIKKEIPTCPLRILYKIIIPNEEPKALTKLEIAKNIASIGIGKKEEPKQETLEDELWGNVFAKIKQYGLNNEVLTILKQNFNISKR